MAMISGSAVKPVIALKDGSSTKPFTALTIIPPGYLSQVSILR